MKINYINDKNFDLIKYSYELKMEHYNENYERCAELKSLLDEYANKYSDVKEVFRCQFDNPSEFKKMTHFSSGRPVEPGDIILSAMLYMEHVIENTSTFKSSSIELKQIYIHPDEYGKLYSLKSIGGERLSVLPTLDYNL